MPQLAPMNWIFLFFYSIIMFFIYKNLNYFINYKNINLNMNLNKNKTNKINWKW
uniref:ATP synthase complex subunit 8 n=1 Tax=Conwentzia sinica TaxID=450904 RepID=A0A7U1G3F7_9NEOP|nr:ATP synthase F0 subunit 8 [Conwentzia sinica]QQY84951.1 ATP synthase F0 subunit 8 [Conwentzia sinica]